MRNAFLLVSAGLVGFGVAQLYGAPQLAIGALVGSVVCAVMLAVFGERRRRRLLTQDRVMEALITEPSLRFARLDRQSVRLVRWTNWWPDPPRPLRNKRWLGLPRRIVIRFAPGALDGSPDWSATVLQVVTNRLQAPYEISRLDHRDLVMWLELSTEVSQTVEKPASEVRAMKAMAKLVDPSVKLLDIQLDENQALTSLKIAHEAPEKMVTAGAQVRLERYVNAMFPGRWRVELDTVNDTVLAQLRPTLPDSVWLPPRELEDAADLLVNYEKVAIPYAIDEDGNEIVWRPAVVPQMLITGGTGTGKTSTTYAIVGEICRHGWPVWVLDGKRVEFLHHRTWPNVQIVATTIPQQVAFVHQVWLLMKERLRLMEEEGVDPSEFEPLVVVLDEWSDFVSELLDWYGTVKQKGDPAKPPTLREHASVTRQARIVRIHLVQTMQRADVVMFGSGAGGEVRSNFGQRLSVGRLDPQGAMMMWNSPHTGTTIPRGIRQRGITTDADGQPREVQFYRFPSMTAAPDSDEGMLRESLRPARARHPRLLILPPEEKESLDGDSPDLGFWDYAETGWVRADARPDLDPVVQSAKRRSLGDGRLAGSTMALLGLRDSELTRELDPGTPGQQSRLRLVEPAEGPAAQEGDSQVDVPVDLDDYTGYADPVLIYPGELEIGDLVQVEEAAGWAVVDEVPEEDVLDPALVAISWRDDTDQAGVISVPADTRIPVRRPEEVS